MDNRKIYEALITIKEYCKETTCTRCALSVGENPYKCKLSDNENGHYPKDWELNDRFDYKAFDFIRGGD